MRQDPKPGGLELWLSQITVQTIHKDTAIKEDICSDSAATEKLLYPTTSLLVFRRYFAGMGASRRQVMFIGLLPSCFT